MAATDEEEEWLCLRLRWKESSQLSPAGSAKVCEEEALECRWF